MASHNLVLEEVINKLHVQTFPHPNPYYATWVSKDNNLLVNEQIILHFSIGQYSDNILCDVMDKSCGHVILGRPWQWSRRNVHDGFTNTYLVHKGGITYKLIPIVDNKMQTVVMCFGKDVLVQGQKQPIDTGWKQDEVEVVQDSGLVDPLFVMIGIVKCAFRKQADEGEREAR